MKKIIILIGLLFLPILVYGGIHNWDSEVKCAYLMESNTNDDTSSGWNGTGFNTPTYSAITFHNDDYSLIWTGNKGINGSSSIETALSTEAVGYSIEAWVYLTADPSRYAFIYQKHQTNTTGSIWICLSGSGGFYPNKIFIKWNGNKDYVWDGFATGVWMHIGVYYDVATNIFYVYKNGTCIGSSNDSCGTPHGGGGSANPGNPFTTNNGQENIGYSNDLGDLSAGFIDNFIITQGVVKTTFPTNPVLTPDYIIYGNDIFYGDYLTY